MNVLIGLLSLFQPGMMTQNIHERDGKWLACTRIAIDLLLQSLFNPSGLRYILFVLK